NRRVKGRLRDSQSDMAIHWRQHIARALPATALAVVLANPISAAAQVQPDFSGHWKISQTKSSIGATGNNATISFPSELVIKQQPAELHVESRYPRSAALTTVYKLDGSEITINLPSSVTEKARARWEGGNLIITARRVVSSAFGEFVTDIKETWSRAGNVLTVQKTQSADGVTDAETAVFDRDQP
ncbi:MAG: hypothetical protein ABW292_06315, partial [Vicinamibacterales bacterium]